MPPTARGTRRFAFDVSTFSSGSLDIISHQEAGRHRIVSGTGIGIANFISLDDSVANRPPVPYRLIRADFLFTLSAVIVQPLSAVWLIFYGLPGIGWC
jgi:uncharacterized membrane protein